LSPFKILNLRLATKFLSRKGTAVLLQKSEKYFTLSQHRPHDVHQRARLQMHGADIGNLLRTLETEDRDARGGRRHCACHGRLFFRQAEAAASDRKMLMKRYVSSSS